MISMPMFAAQLGTRKRQRACSSHTGLGGQSGQLWTRLVQVCGRERVLVRSIAGRLASEEVFFPLALLLLQSNAVLDSADAFPPH